MKGFLIALAAAALVAMTAGGVQGQTSYEEGGATKTIGGLFSSSDGQIEWRAPAQAYILAEEIKLRYTLASRVNLPAPPADTVWVNDPFTLELRERWGESLIILRQPASLTVHYRPEDLGGRSESTLRVVVRSGDRWEEIAGTLDTGNHSVTVRVPYSGDFGLIASNAAPSSGAAAAPAPAAAPAAAGVPMESGVTGRVFYDRNGNALFDGDDFPVQGAELRISSGTWSAATQSGEDGTYSFWVLRQSAYTVEVVVGPEWAFTTPVSVPDIQLTGTAGSIGRADFGMWYRLP